MLSLIFSGVLCAFVLSRTLCAIAGATERVETEFDLISLLVDLTAVLVSLTSGVLSCVVFPMVLIATLAWPFLSTFTPMGTSA